MTDPTISPWLLSLLVGALLAVLLGVSPHRVGRSLLHRLLLIPLAWLMAQYLFAAFAAELGAETAALVMGGASLFILPMLLGRGVRDAIVGSFIYDMLRGVFRLALFLPFALLHWAGHAVLGTWQRIRNHDRLRPF